MKYLLIVFLLLPLTLFAQRYQEQINFNAAGNQEMPLGRYRIDTAIQIQCQITGDWAEDGGI